MDKLTLESLSTQRYYLDIAGGRAQISHYLLIYRHVEKVKYRPGTFSKCPATCGMLLKLVAGQALELFPIKTVATTLQSRIDMFHARSKKLDKAKWLLHVVPFYP